MARTKRKINPLVQEVETSAPAKKIYKTAAYVRLSVEDSDNKMVLVVGVFAVAVWCPRSDKLATLLFYS